MKTPPDAPRSRRREFVRTTLIGSVGLGLVGCPKSAAPLRQQQSREANPVCHAVRDGRSLPRPAADERVDVAIVGGGPSGLIAAYRMRDTKVCLLEKEPSFGGNCRIDRWRGLSLSTGGAFYSEEEEELAALFDEIGLRSIAVRGGDALVLQGESFLDFLGEGAKDLPLSAKIRDDLARFAEQASRQLRDTPPARLERLSFATLLRDYDPWLTRFWDRFGLSNWGGRTKDTAARTGLEATLWAAGRSPRRSFPGGMAAASEALRARLQAEGGEILRPGSAVYAIEVEGDEAIVRYFQGSRARALRAKGVIVALPKFYARRIVAGLSDAQSAAMAALRYAPYLVFNLCFSRMPPPAAYDSWFLDTPFTDAIAADWVLHQGVDPKKGPSAWTVYQPMHEKERAFLLEPAEVERRVERSVRAMERHFPKLRESLVEARAMVRGHPMAISFPGRRPFIEAASAPFGPVFFANTDGDPGVSSFHGACVSAQRALAQLRAHLAG